MFEEECKSYDPMISGLEPEPFDTVFQELFAGVKNYMIPDEPVVTKPVITKPVAPKPVVTKFEIVKPEITPKQRLDENIPQLLSLPVLTREVPTQCVESKFEPVKEVQITTKTRQYAMLRCTCGSDFVSQFALEHHETKYHPELFNWFCSECDIRFDTFQQASDHTLMSHGCGQMPVCDSIYESPLRAGGPLMMQAITRHSTDFIKDFLYSRGRKTIMTTTYYLYAKCELQAITTGSVGLVLYNKAKTDLLTTVDNLEYQDIVACLKSTFIYGRYIKRVPLEYYYGAATIYKTLTFTNAPINTRNTRMGPGRNIRDFVVSNRPQYPVKSQYRVHPYSTNQYRPSLKSAIANRNRSYTVQQSGSQNNIRSSIVPQTYNVYRVRNTAAQ